MTTTSGAAHRARTAAGLVVTCASQFLIGVDGLAVAIALPALRDDLGGAGLSTLMAGGKAFGATLFRHPLDQRDSPRIATRL